LCVRGRRLCYFFYRTAPHLCHHFRHDTHVRRLVPLPARRLWRKVRAIRLQHQRIERQLGGEGARRFVLRVGNRTRQRDEQPQLHITLRQLQRASEAVHHPRRTASLRQRRRSRE